MLGNCDMGQQASNQFFTKDISFLDPEVSAVIRDEFRQQQDEIELIASENIVSRAVGLNPALADKTQSAGIV